MYTSPLAERFTKISEKLGTIPTNVETSRAHRIDQLDIKVRSVEERFNDAIGNYNRQVGGLRDEVLKLQKMLEEDNKYFEHQLDSRITELNNLDGKLTQKLEAEIVARRDSENKLQRYLEEKSNALKSDISIQTKLRSEIIDGINSTLENDIPKLYDLVKTETQEREECDTITVKKTSEELRKLNDAVSGQKKAREESESSIFDMLKDLVNRVKTEIDDERKEREQSQETLLGLLEDACNKLCSTTQQ
ncbi:hypothetical protein PPERSA_12480 [Pseudocohnilembus persalinus]|uniref:Uncharacterized protein n=1 Tax=Pseudocohnilembus persalinus TaxID=266149 RepID=A0A0V0QPH8_PSEPJ|nr:hypothetical protein PPERSA_12480 [Pseudocohnilembus persalinus]|eukprot:KRX04033.1 hypothetical protein PPERSA_12480 [Pseudocohnilembus persalinus]